MGDSLAPIWAPLGPLVGILIAHFLVTSWERRRWIADNRKEEYRRILAAFNKVNMLMIEYHNTGFANLAAIKEAIDESSLAVNTSLFINDFLAETKVAGDIVAAVKKLNNGGSFDDYQKEYWNSINLILAAANKSAL